MPYSHINIITEKNYFVNKYPQKFTNLYMTAENEQNIILNAWFLEIIH